VLSTVMLYSSVTSLKMADALLCGRGALSMVSGERKADRRLT
jgi:hypothetical protein